jgi:hypothetical protein
MTLPNLVFLQQPRAVLNAAFDIVSDAVMAAMEAEYVPLTLPLTLAHR